MDNLDRQKIVARSGGPFAHIKREMDEISREAKALRTELKSVAMIVAVAALFFGVSAGLVIFGKKILDAAETMPIEERMSVTFGVSIALCMATLIWRVLRGPPTSPSPKPAAPERERRETEQPTRPATRCESCGAPTSGKQCDHCGSAT